ncbi:MAG TPA: hypothetical protein VIJ11_01335 [Galbitalea sp.]
MSVAPAARSIPLWVASLLVFLGSRLYSTALLVGTYFTSKATGVPFASKRVRESLWNYFGAWDASYYRRISEHGYPQVLPMAHGQVAPNSWAFYPVFPGIVHAVTVVTGLNPDAAGVLVATLAGAGAAVILGRLLDRRIGYRAAVWTVAVFSFGPVSFLLQLPYAESLFCLLLFASLVALAAQRYLVVACLGVIAAFTRPGELALPLAIGILVALRWRNAGARKDRAWLIGTAAVTAVAGLAWPVIAGWVTGVPAAYVETELSWWTGYVGRVSFVPLSPWFIFAVRYLGVIGVVLVLATVAAVGWWLTRRSVRAIGTETLLFGGAYLLYLFAVLLPQQSIFRLLMPATPLLGDPALSASRRMRWAVLGAGVVLQPVAIILLWQIGYP